MTVHAGEDTTDTRVVVIGPDGSPVGGIGRELAHLTPGVLHLAVSIQVVDHDGRWLLQRRAATKTAFAARWANTCCTHPRLGEEPEVAAIRRLGQELALEVDDLISAGVFVYRATDPVSGLVEHEMDHVFVTVADTDSALIDPEEISELARLTYPEALRLVSSEHGAPWAAEVLRRCFDVLDTR